MVQVNWDACARVGIYLVILCGVVAIAVALVHRKMLAAYVRDSYHPDDRDLCPADYPETEDEKFLVNITPEDWLPRESEWVHRYNNWSECVRCHCGYINYGNLSQDQGVCPKCGHKDKWESVVERQEWDQGPSVLWCQAPEYRPGGEDRTLYRRSTDRSQASCRNRKTVRWTEDACPVETEARSEKDPEVIED